MNTSVSALILASLTSSNARGRYQWDHARCFVWCWQEKRLGSCEIILTLNRKLGRPYMIVETLNNGGLARTRYLPTWQSYQPWKRFAFATWTRRRAIASSRTVSPCRCRHLQPKWGDSFKIKHPYNKGKCFLKNKKTYRLKCVYLLFWSLLYRVIFVSLHRRCQIANAVHVSLHRSSFFDAHYFYRLFPMPNTACGRR